MSEDGSRLCLGHFGVGLSFSTHNRKVIFLRVKSSKKLYHVVVVFPNGMTRNVKVKAASREVAESKALKFHPRATGVKRETA